MTATTPQRKTGMARLWELAFTEKLLIVGAAFFSIVSVISSFVPFIAIYFIIGELLIHLPNVQDVDRDMMIAYGWLAAGGAIAAVFFNGIALLCSHLAAFRTLYQLKIQFTRHLAHLPMGFHNANATGKTRKIIDENIEKLEGFIAHQLPDMVGSFAAPLVLLVLIFSFDWRFGLACLLPIILAYAIQIMGFGGKDAQTFVYQYQNALEDMNNAAVEYVRGIAVVKAFNQTIFSFRKFHETIQLYTDFCLRYTYSYKPYMSAFLVILYNVYLFIIPVTIWLAGGGQDYPSFALAVLFYLIFSTAIPTVFTKMMYVSSISRQIADGIMRMDRILDTPPLLEVAEAKQITLHAVEFDHVTFSYSDDTLQESAISDITFTAHEGEYTALVGPSGSGKSTIAHLIPRFFDVNTGAIRIGGVDIREMTTEYLLRQVSFVFQDLFLFKQSIRDNIKVGDPQASDEAVIAAAKAAQCHEFIQQLPEGYDTIIGSKGVYLSGGEQQRIAIARAILKNAPIIVLDEATAFADPENEQKIQQAFESLMHGKTVIVIAHRLSTVRDANQIIVLEHGKLIERGTHAQLVAQGGKYRRMWENYNSTLSWSLAEGELTDA